MKLAFVLVILLIIFCFVAGPVLLIWSLNALFDLGIAYNLKTWAASFILCATFNMGILNNKNYGKENYQIRIRMGYMPEPR